MQIPPSAQEVKAAVTKKGIEAIPFPDLREQGRSAYQKQLAACKNYACNTLTDEKEINAASYRGRACHEQRIAVRTIFKKAIGRVTEVLQQMKPGDPLKPDLTKVLKELVGSQKTHEIAIEEVNNAVLKCEAKLKALKK